jgi:hypothetical protein
MDAVRVQDGMIERMADKLIEVVASILESQRAHRVEEKAVEEVGVGSGGHDAQVMVASAVAAAAPMATAVKRRNRRKTARKKTAGVGGSLVSTDDGSTDSTVLLESRSDVDDWIDSTDDMRMDAAGGAESMVGGMQTVEEAIDEEVGFRGSAGIGVLPPDGGVQQRLEKELESARLFCFVLFCLSYNSRSCHSGRPLPLRILSRTYTMGLRVTAEETRCRIAT